MAKDKLMEGVPIGYGMAVRAYQEGGEEAMLKEAMLRNATTVWYPMKMKDLVKIREMCRSEAMDAIATVSVMALRDEYRFSHDRLCRFLAAFEKKAECLEPGMGWTVTIEQYKTQIREETGIDLFGKY